MFRQSDTLHSGTRTYGCRIIATDGEVGRVEDLYFDDGKCDLSIRHPARSWSTSRERRLPKARRSPPMRVTFIPHEAWQASRSMPRTLRWIAWKTCSSMSRRGRSWPVRTLRHHVSLITWRASWRAARYLRCQSIIITNTATIAKAASPALIAQSGLILRGCFVCVDECGTEAAAFAGALAARLTSCWRAGEYELGTGISLTPSKTVDDATVREER